MGSERKNFQSLQLAYLENVAIRMDLSFGGSFGPSSEDSVNNWLECYMYNSYDNFQKTSVIEVNEIITSKNRFTLNSLE